MISPTEIQLWLIRGSGVWPNNAYAAYSTIGASHPDGMSLAMTANWGVGAANWMMDCERSNRHLGTGQSGLGAGAWNQRRWIRCR